MFPGILYEVMTQKHLTKQRFTNLDLPAPLLQGLVDTGFTFCTPIQAEALPLALAGQDVEGQAQTGFLLALMSYLIRKPPRPDRTVRQPRGLVLAPTRELAIQIHKDATILGRHTSFKTELVYGGTGYQEQREALEQGVDILVGTPGRLIDYSRQNLFDLKALQVVVLDEADRMFDLGFIRDIRYLFRRMPPPQERLNMLFSATLSLRVNELAYEHMNNPQVIRIESEHLTVDQVSEQVYFPANVEKIPLLLGLLKQSGAVRTLVFVNTKREAEKVEGWLRGNDYLVGVLSGDVPQRRRERLLQDFRTGSIPVLVATDVAARGLHIPDVSHVINYDLSQDPEDYVHRIGRTARAGASGDAISFACERYAFSLNDIEQYIGHKIPVHKVSEVGMVEPLPPIVQKSKRVRGGSRKRVDPGKQRRISALGRQRHGKTPNKKSSADASDGGPARAQPAAKEAQGQPTGKKSAGGKRKKKAVRAKRRSPETPAIG